MANFRVKLLYVNSCVFRTKHTFLGIDFFSICVLTFFLSVSSTFLPIVKSLSLNRP